MLKANDVDIGDFEVSQKLSKHQGTEVVAAVERFVKAGNEFMVTVCEEGFLMACYAGDHFDLPCNQKPQGASRKPGM